jgi:hypothetical protein
MYPNPPSSDPDILMSAPDISDISDISSGKALCPLGEPQAV